MGGRFGKYGDIKRRKVLQRAGRAISQLERAKKTSRSGHRGLRPTQTKILTRVASGLKNGQSDREKKLF